MAGMTGMGPSRFRETAKAALANADLQEALGKIRGGAVERRRAAAENLPEFDTLRDKAMDIKNHTLAHLDIYFEEYEKRVTEAGGHVHFAPSAQDARRIILQICHDARARTVTKGKSMVGEELGLNEYLENNGITPVETDLGEYLVQIRHELPSHIIFPAVHLTRDDIEAGFRQTHTDLDPGRKLDEPRQLLDEARAVLRKAFLSADVGITGANFLVAETGSSIIVTNEGNGDLTQSLPRVHIVVASLEKMVPTLEDAATILRLLARSATGQEMSVYTTWSTGPRRAEDPDGPEQYHVVILDGGRSALLGSEFQEVLRCIRCGACMNHCPVYQAVGGHAYGWVYPGPIGAVINPALLGVEETLHLPNASTLCGKCEEICPMRIPLPRMMRHWREKQFERHLAPFTQRWGLGLWKVFAKRPALYQKASFVAALALRFMGGRKNHLRFMPLAMGWTRARDFPAPQGQTFQRMWRNRNRGVQ